MNEVPLPHVRLMITEVTDVLTKFSNFFHVKENFKGKKENTVHFDEENVWCLYFLPSKMSGKNNFI